MYLIVFFVVLVAVCGSAAILGGIPERVGAAAFPAAAALSTKASIDTIARWSDLQSGLLLIDAVLFGTMLWITVRYDRWWTLLATAALAVSLLAHFARLTHLALSAKAYAAMEGLPSVLTIVALAFGTLEYRARLRSGRCDRR